jgi:hypothetical protein
MTAALPISPVGLWMTVVGCLSPFVGIVNSPRHSRALGPGDVGNGSTLSREAEQ